MCTLTAVWVGLLVCPWSASKNSYIFWTTLIKLCIIMQKMTNLLSRISSGNEYWLTYIHHVPYSQFVCFTFYAQQIWLILICGIGVYPYFLYSRYLNQKTAMKRMVHYRKLVFVKMDYQVNSYWHSIPSCSKMKTLSMIMLMVRAREPVD